MQKEKTEARMRNLIAVLNDARKKYYNGKDESPLTDRQYDALLYELEALEEAAGIKLAESPTQLVGYAEPELKVQHFSPILSLKDTKDIDEVVRFLGEDDGVLSWKLDGVSIVVHYENGAFNRALSRGDGHFGRDITKNVVMMNNVPFMLPEPLDIIIRGEGCILIHDFEALRLTDEGEHYHNPRNMAAGLINRSKSDSPLLRYMWFIPHSVVYLQENGHRIQTRMKHFELLTGLGFTVVPNIRVNNYSLKQEIEKCSNSVEGYEFPVDGLVISINDICVGDKRGATAHHPKHSLAYKWPDECTETTVTGIKWSVSPNGLITPVVQFEPVEMDGTTVKQATLHNLKRFEDLAIGVGDIIKIYKANKIVPQVEENITRSATEEYPLFCPVCHKPTYTTETSKTKKLHCWYCAQDRSIL